LKKKKSCSFFFIWCEKNINEYIISL